jgi:hypothetical protein
MAKLTEEQWATIRGEREAGVSFGELAKRHGISKASIVARSQAENWQVDPAAAAAVRRKAAERVIGLTEPVPPLTAAEAKKSAIDRQADRAAAVILKHQAQWRIVGTLQDEALRDRHTDPEGAFARAKLAKITAETIAIKQAGERKAHGLDAPKPAQTDDDAPAPVKVEVHVRDARVTPEPL